MTEFKCEKCNKEFQSKDALSMHNKAKHPESYKEPKLSKKNKKRIRNYVITLLIVLVIGSLLYRQFAEDSSVTS